MLNVFRVEECWILFVGKGKTRKPINRNVINMTKLRDPVNAVKIKRGYTIRKDINGIIFEGRKNMLRARCK